MTDSGRPRVDYWHLYTDDQGVSRQRNCAFTDFEHRSISEPASPQWIIPLSGRWFVESMDGQRIEMGPGELSLGADQGTRELNGRKGHLSGTVGDLPAVLWLVQLDEAPAPLPPCPFS